MSHPIRVTISHGLGRAEARRRIDAGFGDFSRHLGGPVGALDRSWTGDRLDFALTAVGQSISGHVAVDDTMVTVEVLLPGLLGLMANRLRGRLQREGQLLLEKKPGN